jgi:hypothetical protein
MQKVGILPFMYVITNKKATQKDGSYAMNKWQVSQIY